MENSIWNDIHLEEGNNATYTYVDDDKLLGFNGKWPNPIYVILAFVLFILLIYLFSH